MEYIQLVNQRAQLTKQINEYLDVHSDTMDDNLNTHPVWQPYNQMLAEYAKIEDQIRVKQYVQNAK